MNRSSSFAWRPKTTLFLLGGFVLILIAVIAAFALSNFKPTTRVSINSAVYDVQLADTEAEREQGLSSVKSLSPNEGLLMQFDASDLWGIWMKDMLIPLDIIWLDEAKNVVYIKENVSPELGIDVVMRPKEPSRYVLELPAGSVKNTAIKVGQQASFTIEGENQ